MKTVSMTIAAMAMAGSMAAQADSNLGHFGPYAQANDNVVVSAGEQVAVPAEGRMSAYSPAVEVETGHEQIAISPEGRLSAYRS